MEMSRSELLAWVNEVTNLSVTKIESMGTGAAHCALINSIFRDVPLHKVNFKAIHEYEFVHNFKVLQEAFTRHRIDRTIPVERMIKLKFQDNLEFLQWMKKYWDANFDGTVLAGKPAGPANASTQSVSKRHLSQSHSQTASAGLSRSNSSAHFGSLASSATVVAGAGAGAASSPPATSQAAGGANNLAQLAALTKTITELKVSVDEMEKERDFYFNKLRDIEILTQKVTDPVISGSVFYRQVTEILYTTEDGFEIPAGSDGAASGAVLASA